jgi:hypothetical protein
MKISKQLWALRLYDQSLKNKLPRGLSFKFELRWSDILQRQEFTLPAVKDPALKNRLTGHLEAIVNECWDRRRRG